jgi:hypothetical protein
MLAEPFNLDAKIMHNVINFEDVDATFDDCVAEDLDELSDQLQQTHAVLPPLRMTSKSFDFDSASSARTSSGRGDVMDLYISGVGWVSLRGAGKATLTVRAPPGTLKLSRAPPLLPFEHQSARRHNPF